MIMKKIKNPRIRVSKTRTLNGQPLWALCDGIKKEVKWYIDERSAKIAMNDVKAEKLMTRSYVSPENAVLRGLCPDPWNLLN